MRSKKLNLKFSKLRTKANSALWEWKLGVNTTGKLMNVPGSDSISYSTVPYSEILTILRSLCLEPSDVFVVLGCGKGRVVCCASQFKVREVVGVEIDKSLSNVAQSNAQRIRRRKSAIRIINTPAEDFDYRNGSVYYLYHPFGASTLSKVLERIKQALRSQPRRVRIVYVFPQHESVLDHTDWLKCYDLWEKETVVFHKVSFWRSKDE